MTNLEKTILIDRYLSHEMSQAERQNFERLLSESDSSYNGEPSLMEEMALQKQIEDTIRERGLREMLKKDETDIRQKEETDIRRKRHIKRITLWSLGGGSMVTAIAAVLLLLLVVAPMARMMQDYSNNYVEQIEIGKTRSYRDYDSNRLNNAIRQMKNNEWDEANAIIDNVLQKTAGSQEEQVREIYDNAEWLKAICLMHDGKVIKAKRLLRKIANSESSFSHQAKEILQK